MSNHTYIGIGVVVIALIIIGFLAMKHDKGIMENEGMATTTGMVEEGAAMKAKDTPAQKGTTSGTSQQTSTSALKSALASQSPTQCTYERVSGNDRSTNNLYIASGKVRGEFRSSNVSGNTNTLMVYDGANLYTWTEGMATGKKSSVRSVTDIAMLIPDDKQSGAIFGASLDNVSWDCHAWLLDKTKLAVPTYVKFQ